MTILLRLASFVTFFIATIGVTATGDSMRGDEEVHIPEYTAIVTLIHVAGFEVWYHS